MVVTTSKVCLKFRRNNHRTLVDLHNVLGFRKANDTSKPKLIKDIQRIKMIRLLQLEIFNPNTILLNTFW